MAFLFLAGSAALLAQTGVQVSYMVPQNGLQYRLKRTAVIEVVQGIGLKMDDPLRVLFSAGFYSYRPLPDTFRIWTYKPDNTNPRGGLEPGWQAIRSAVTIPLSVTCPGRMGW